MKFKLENLTNFGTAHEGIFTVKNPYGGILEGILIGDGDMFYGDEYIRYLLTDENLFMLHYDITDEIDFHEPYYISFAVVDNYDGGILDPDDVDDWEDSFSLKE